MAVRDLRQGTHLHNTVFLLLAKEQRTTKTQKPFLHVEVGDATGRINGVMWALPPALAALTVGAGVAVTGDVESYQGTPQIKIVSIVPAEIRPADFLPTAARSTEELVAAVHEVMGRVAHPWLAALLRQVFTAELLPIFCTAPAAKALHHARLGGLAEHSLAIAAFVDQAGALYPTLDVDLLRTLALLHDVGKVTAYQWDVLIDVTDVGSLLDHIFLGAKLVGEGIAALPGFPPELGTRILHGVLAHHGNEGGSPVRLQTLEAVLLHLLDMLDSRAQGFLDHQAAQPDPVQLWTTYSTMFATRLYRGNGAESAEVPTASAAGEEDWLPGP